MLSVFLEVLSLCYPGDTSSLSSWRYCPSVILGILVFCHPERSEGSAAMADVSSGTQILRFAQDDITGYPNDIIGYPDGITGYPLYSCDNGSFSRLTNEVGFSSISPRLRTDWSKRMCAQSRNFCSSRSLLILTRMG